MSQAYKRPFIPNSSDPKGRDKWRKTTPNAYNSSTFKIPSGATVFRVICPNSKSGGVIGKGGTIISKIRGQTGAKVKLEDQVPGCEARTVLIIGSEKDIMARNEHEKEVNKADVNEDDAKNDKNVDEHEKEDNKAYANEDDAKDDKNVDEHEKEDNKADANEDDAKDDKNVDEGDKDDKNVDEGDKDDKNVDEGDIDDKNVDEGNTKFEGPKPSEKEFSSAQKALMLIFERIMERELESDGGGENNDVESNSSSVTIGLLIMQSQVGYLLENDGIITKQMESDSGAHISVLSRDKVPACASPQEEVLQITGEINSTKKALQLVSQFLIEHPAKYQAPTARPTNSNPKLEVRSSGKSRLPHKPHFPNRVHDHDAPQFPNFENAGPGQYRGGTPEFIVFRMVCSNDRVGSVIGKGGSIVKSLHLQTGSEIKILVTSPETEDRLIVVSSPAIPVEGLLPAQDCVLRVQHRIAMSVPGGRDNVLARLIVASNQIGCILGKRGSVISEMRKISGANIRVLSRDQTPPYVSDHEELVQVSGELNTVQNALLQITDRLKDHCFRIIHGGQPPFIGQMPPPPFGAPHFGRDFSSPRVFPDYPPFQNEFPGHPFEERPPFPHGPPGPHGPGPHGPPGPLGFERMPPSPWEHQALRNSGSMPMPEYQSGPPQRRIGGFSSGDHPALFTKTVEVTVPRSAVSSICGEDGGCLRQICEISEAKITITDPKPDDTETIIMINGTQEQTHAAQSLIQAFVLSETAAT